MPKVLFQENPSSDFRTWPQERQVAYLQKLSLEFLKNLQADIEAGEFVVLVQQMKEVVEQTNLGQHGIVSSPTGQFQIAMVIQLTKTGIDNFKKEKEIQETRKSEIKSSIILLK